MLRAMLEHQPLLFEDAESVTRRPALNVVHASAASVAAFDVGYFAGFASMRALTYSTSVPMIAGLLAEHRFEDFECVFGHGGILSREAEEILAFQYAVREQLGACLLARPATDAERDAAVRQRVASDEVRFFVVKDAIAHAKIYLLSGPGKRRVMVGSANLSERAFSGRQAETLVVFDDDDVAWRHYLRQYEAVRDTATCRLPLPREPLPKEQVRVEETPALVEAEAHPEGATLFVPAQTAAEEACSVPAVTARIETIKPVLRRGLAGLRPGRDGRLRIAPKVVKEIVRIARSRDVEAAPPTFLSRAGDRFTLSDRELSLEASEDEARADVAAWLEFFGNYENGFVGDVPRLQRDYFTFMCWFYFAPLMCDLRNLALRGDAFSFDQPLFAVLYGSSNCGKTSLVEALMASMFSHPRIVDSQDFTPGKLRGLQQTYKRFPVVFDDITRDRFSRYADEIIKDETIPYREYPCFALSMNADARSFKPEIVKRCLMIYTRTSLPGDNTRARRLLQRSVAGIRGRMSTALFRTFLREAAAAVDEAAGAQDDAVDALRLASGLLCELFAQLAPAGARLPPWCAPMTLAEYQERAFERPRLYLSTLLDPSRHSRARRPPEGCWSIVGDKIIVSVASIEFARTRADIPDWLLDDAGSAAGKIALSRELTEDFLGRNVRPRWPWRR